MTEFLLIGKRDGVPLTVEWVDGEFVPPGVADLILAWSESMVAVTPTGPFIERDLASAESAWRTAASVFDVVTDASGYVPPAVPGVPDGSDA